MVILFGHMSHCEALLHQVALEDVWMALDMLPSFRWRWERKELNNSHPLIATLAKKVFGVNLRQAGPSSHPVLMPELDLDLEGTSSPITTHTTASTPSLSNTTYTHGTSGTPAFPGSPPIGPAIPTTSQAHVPGSASGSANGPVESKLAEVPVNLFYPFYPATSAAAATTPGTNKTTTVSGGADYSQCLAQAAASHQPAGQWGASGQESYMLEEKNVGVPMSDVMGMWMPDQRNMWGYVVAS